jgi:hypothetical protein
MNGNIYLIQDNGDLVPMRESKYDSEDLLQALLAKYPDLLAGDQIDNAAPRKWLLVKREVGLPSEDEGGDEWSVDHLFLYQDATPTIVEVKRSSDTRIRREVVGQMLDYAANTVVYWPVERIRAEFEKNSANPQLLLNELLGASASPDEFWKKVETNLHAGKIRMVFVADEVPQKLQRIVEFLNGQMERAEVLAVEVKQYVGQTQKTLVPRVIGQTAEAQQKKAGGGVGREWNEQLFFQEIESKCGKDETRVAKMIFEWAKANSLRMDYGSGKVDGSFIPYLRYADTFVAPIAIKTSGYVSLQFYHIKSRPPFDTASKRIELLARLNKIPNIKIDPEAIAGKPKIDLQALRSEKTLKQFLETLQWFFDQFDPPGKSPGN